MRHTIAGYRRRVCSGGFTDDDSIDDETSTDRGALQFKENKLEWISPACATGYRCDQCGGSNHSVGSVVCVFRCLVEASASQCRSDGADRGDCPARHNR